MIHAVKKKKKVELHASTDLAKTLFGFASWLVFLGIVIVSVLFYAALFSYSIDDPAWTNATGNVEIQNWMGAFGANAAAIGHMLFGKLINILPIVLCVCFYHLLIKSAHYKFSIDTLAIKLVVLLVCIAVGSGFLQTVFGIDSGVVGDVMGKNLILSLNKLLPLISIDVIWYCVIFILVILFFIGLMILTGVTPIYWVDIMGKYFISFSVIIYGFLSKLISLDKYKKVDAVKSSFNLDHLMERVAVGEVKVAASQTVIQEPNFSNDNFNEGFNENFDARLSSQQVYAETQVPRDIDIIEKSYLSLNQNDENDQNEHLDPDNILDFGSRVEYAEVSPEIFSFTVSDSAINYGRNESIGYENNDLATTHQDIKDSFEFIEHVEHVEHKDHLILNNIENDTVFSTEGSVESLKSEPLSLWQELVEQRKSSLEKAMFNTQFDNFETAPNTIQDMKADINTNNYNGFEIVNSNSDLLEMDLSESFFSEPLIENYSGSQNFHQKKESQFLLDEVSQTIVESKKMSAEIIFADENSSISERDTHQASQSQNSFIHSLINPVTPPLMNTQTRQMGGYEVDLRTGAPKPIVNRIFPNAGMLPPLSLLTQEPVKTKSYHQDELDHMAGLIEVNLKNFGISVTVVHIDPGPVITRFELDLAPGVKVSQINNLDKDLARGLSVSSLRVVDIIPGKPFVGLEIPNRHREMVYFRTGMETNAYQNSRHPLTMVLGKNTSGEPVIANLAKMPHLLVAGTTGSGKSVGVNTMLLSMLFKARADELRMILIDPKMLELANYNDIPHLLTPVITDMKDAANALRWCVSEMERRYLLMSKLKVKGFDSYNEMVKNSLLNGGAGIPDPLWVKNDHVSDNQMRPSLKPFFYIVVVIDEFADMMMQVGKKCEELIARLAQKARASGIHLIVATQRPSADILTGIIKANIPTRIAFQVSSKIDSRVVLEQQGAESLLGNGDMLFMAPGSGAPVRVHGAFVNEQEVNDVADFLRLTGEPEFIDDVTQEPTEAIAGLSNEASGVLPSESDPLFDEAVKYVVESRKTSVSALQRRMRIGFNRAANIMDELEHEGIVTSMSNGTREILISPEDL